MKKETNFDNSSFIKRLLTLIIILIAFLSGNILINDSNIMDEKLTGNVYTTYHIIKSESNGTLILQPFVILYDFSKGEGNINFTSDRNERPLSYIQVNFPEATDTNITRILLNGKEINENDYIFGDSKMLFIQSESVFLNNNVTECLIEFSSNWTPSGTFHFDNMGDNTRTASNLKTKANVILILGDKYQMNSDIKCWNLKENYISSQEIIQLNFDTKRLTRFGSSVKFSSIDKTILTKKENYHDIGLGFIIGSILLGIPILSSLLYWLIVREI